MLFIAFEQRLHHLLHNQSVAQGGLAFDAVEDARNEMRGDVVSRFGALGEFDSDVLRCVVDRPVEFDRPELRASFGAEQHDLQLVGQIVLSHLSAVRMAALQLVQFILQPVLPS